jgi:N-acetylglucosamine kinase-like BadF-type ATPase
MKYVLGVDGGATKTVFKAKDTENDFVVEVVKGSSNIKSNGLVETGKNITDGIKEIVERLKKEFPSFSIFSGACFGVAGLDFELDKKSYESIIFSKENRKYFIPSKTIICNDSRIGLEAGSTSPNRLMLICGTGSNCYGINESGQEAGSNGWDYILGDEGSGYSIAIKALRAIMRAYDGRGDKTLLSDAVLKYLGLSSELELVHWAYKNTISKNDIAAITSLVCVTANAGDQMSKKILEGECDEAILTVSTVIKKLKLENSCFDLVLVGSVFNCKKYYKDLFMSEINKRFSGVNIKKPVKKPVEGAIKLALEKLNN